MADKAPLKWIDIKSAINSGINSVTPGSLAFMLSPETRGIPEVPAEFDQRRLPFSDIPMQLRDQRQYSLANPESLNPFSAEGALRQLQQRKNIISQY